MTEIVKHEPTTIYIKPTTGLAALNLHDLWIYRELVFFMVWRDVKVKYKQTLLGMAWAVIQPVMTMLVFTFLFGKVAKLPTDGIPYPVFSFTLKYHHIYYMSSRPVLRIFSARSPH